MSEPDDPIIPLAAAAGAARCPICSKPVVAAYHPFCSTRCARIDLGRWLNGSYRVETDEPADDSGDATG